MQKGPCKDPALAVFENISTAHPGNVERDVHRRLKNLHGCQLEPFYITVPVRCMETDGMTEMVLPSLAPYEVFAELWSFGAQFTISLLGEGPDIGDQISAYWDALARSPENHHVNVDPEARRNRAWTVPLHVHTDGGEVFNGTEYSMWTWGSVLTHGISSWDCKLLICIVPEAVKTHETVAEIVEFLGWNFKVLESGRHPHCDHHGAPLSGRRAALAGRPIAGGWRASFAGFLSDMKERAQLHRLRQNFQRTKLCEKCHAVRNSQTMNAYNFEDGADWMLQLISQQEYLGMAQGEARSPWAQVESWNIYGNRDDLLHMVYLGFGKDVAGQLLFDFAWQYGGGDLDASLFELSVECRRWLKERGLVSAGIRSWSKSTVGRSSENDFPTLESQMKGAVCKNVLLWACWKARVGWLKTLEYSVLLKVWRGTLHGVRA